MVVTSVYLQVINYWHEAILRDEFNCIEIQMWSKGLKLDMCDLQFSESCSVRGIIGDFIIYY